MFEIGDSEPAMTAPVRTHHFPVKVENKPNKKQRASDPAYCTPNILRARGRPPWNEEISHS
jgi:hypothetical protein